MNRIDKKTWIMTGIFFVAIVLLTWLVRVPLDIKWQSSASPSGANFNMGDFAVMVGAGMLGGPLGALCAALGSALGDIFAGAAIYALPSMVIKAAMAFLMAFLLKKGDMSWVALARYTCYTGLVMVAGYFLFDLVIMGDYSVAALSLPVNALQLLANAIVAIPVLKFTVGKSYGKQDEVTTSSRVR